MKTLSLTQPWATLVTIGAKRIETRSWGTRYRGPIAIHAAKGLASVGGHSGLIDLCLDSPFSDVLRDHGKGLLVPGHDLPLGMVLATASLIDCVEIRQTHDPVALPRFIQHAAEYEQDFGDYQIGRWMWLLDHIQALPEPIPARGSLGLWEWSRDEVAA